MVAPLPPLASHIVNPSLTFVSSALPPVIGPPAPPDPISISNCSPEVTFLSAVMYEPEPPPPPRPPLLAEEYSHRGLLNQDTTQELVGVEAPQQSTEGMVPKARSSYIGIDQFGVD